MPKEYGIRGLAFQGPCLNGGSRRVLFNNMLSASTTIDAMCPAGSLSEIFFLVPVISSDSSIRSTTNFRRMSMIIKDENWSLPFRAKGNVK